jgi:3'(2'), 5'-bisphosphate nucleotidase
MSASDLVELALTFARISDDAGRIIQAVKRAGPHVERKADASPVTEADRLAEAHITAALARILPGVPVVAEEQASAGLVPNIGSTFLLVDPLDGTQEFIAGRPEYTVNIALIENGAPVVGAVAAPELARTYAGAPGWAGRRGDGAADFTPIVTRTMPMPPTVVTSISHRDPATEAWLTRWPDCARTCIGSSLKFALVAEGFADIYPRFGPTCEWDTAAGHAVLCAAGGAVLTPEGAPFRYGKIEASFRNGPFIAWGGVALP